MKILLLSNLDWPSFQFLDNLLPKLAEHDCQVMLTRRVGPPGPVPQALVRLALRDQLNLRAALGLISDEATNLVESAMTEAMAERYGCSVILVDNLNQGSGKKIAEIFNPELIVSVRFGSILRPPIIGLPRFGVINLHSGLLPEYRGIMATFWAMIRKEANYGFTVHQIIDQGIDTGPILARRSYPLDLRLDYSTLLANLYRLALPVLVGAIEQIQRGGFLEMRESKVLGEYFGLPNQAAIERFETMGYRWWPEA